MRRVSEQLGIFSSAARAHFRRTPQRYQHRHAFRLPPSLKLGEAVRQGPPEASDRASAQGHLQMEKALVKTAEELVAEAELAELRQLTPEQQAAAAKAAQRIGEVAAAAEAAPEEERAASIHPNGQE